MSPTFGLIAEGITDQIILKNILLGYFNDPDLIVKNLQPTDKTEDDDEKRQFGGWYKVFKYCQDGDLISDFVFTDFLIIQIDSDIAHLTPFDVPQSPQETITERILERLLALVKIQTGEEEYELYSARIIFAISVDEIECWLLPLYYTNTIQAAVNNCLFKLNRQLPENSKIIPNNKQPRIYKNISSDFRKVRTFKNSYPKNPSLKTFIEDLMLKVPIADISDSD